MQIYSDFVDRYNVRIGPRYTGNEFFEITTVNGNSAVPGFNTDYGDCNTSVVGSSEGALYKTNLNEKSVLWYWRKALCRQVPLYFEKRVQKGPFEGLKYVLRENVYDRFENLDNDCYKGMRELLPDGLSDLSKCYYSKSHIPLKRNVHSIMMHFQICHLLHRTHIFTDAIRIH